MTGLGLNLRAHTLAVALANQQLDLFASHDSYRQSYTSHIVDRLSSIPFLDMPKISDAQQDRHAWYAFVMQFNPDKAPQGLTRDEFVRRLNERGLKEVDIPKSTCLLNELPLFTHSHIAIPRYGEQPWHALQPTSEFPIADAFYKRAIKLPGWATDNDRPIVEHYINTFLAVAEEVGNSGLVESNGTSSENNANGYTTMSLNGEAHPPTNGQIDALANGLLKTAINGHANGQAHDMMNGHINGQINGKTNGHVTIAVEEIKEQSNGHATHELAI